MEQNVFLALLAMDAYNRGPAGSGSRIDGLSSTLGTNIGQATLRYVSLGSDYSSSGYTALGYEWNGNIVVSYRGTDNISTLPTSDVQGGWLTGAGYGSAQAAAALDTYDTVVSNLLSSQITGVILTGQSLGGGLAGYVSALTGADAVLFEHMPYMDAAEADSSITFTNQIAFHVQDEALQDLRYLWSDSDEAVSTQLSIYGAEVPSHQEYFITFPSSFYLHQPEMNVIMMFGNQSSIGTDWHESAKYFIPALFDWSIIDSINVNAIEEAPYHNQKMLGAIAYSSLDAQEDGNLIFGDTGIRALFNDASDLGNAISTTYSSTFSEGNKYSAAKMIAQFSGTMALNKVENNNYAREGIINFDEYTLSFVTSDKLWSSYGSYTPSTSVRVGYDDLFGDALTEIGFSQNLIFAEDDMKAWYVDSSVSNLLYTALSNIDRFENTGSAEAFGAIVKLYDNSPGIQIGDNWEGRLNSDDAILTIGNAIDNEIRGSSRDDVIYGGDGDDILEGRGGKNVLIGGTGTDTADYSSGTKPISIMLSDSDLSVKNQFGTDYLVDIETIKGTAARDRVVVEGAISSEIDQLTIDANGGQGPSPEDTIDLSGSDSRNTIYIDELGNGAIIDLDTDANINLQGFHTNLLGSYQDDTITDESSGTKRIFADEGDDVVTVTGGPAYVDGGLGEDTITGGAYNDVLVGGEGNDALNGGAGSDTLIGIADKAQYWGDPVDEDILNGGDGADMLINGKVMTGGAGNDIIDARGYAGLSGATVNFAVGDGHDWIMNGENGSGVSVIDLSTVSRDDVTLYWDGNAVQQAPGSQYYAGIGTLSIVLDSGDSISIENVESGYWLAGSSIESVKFITPQVRFSEGLQDLNGPQEQPHYMDVIYSSYGAADVALTDYQTSLGGGNVSGSAGDDQLDGSSGDDDVSAGDGNDDVSLSGGNDNIDGGNGDDTVTFFDSIEGFKLGQSAGGIRLTSASGLEGTAAITNVENFYSIADDRTWTLAQMLGRISTTGNDNMIGTDDYDNLFADAGDDTLKGFGGNDHLDGGDGDDQAIFRGNSTDYAIGSLNGTQTVIDLTGQDGTDYLYNIESLYFEGDQAAIAVDDISSFTGTIGDNILTGTSGRDAMYTSGGNDIFDAGDGDDFIASSSGTNAIDGGNGTDVVSYYGASSDYNIVANSDGTVSVEGLSWWNPVDVLSNVEYILFSSGEAPIKVADLMPDEPSGPVPIYGTSSNDNLVGTADDDTIYGGDGDDSIDGGAGADLMYGGTGNDFYTVDNSSDVIVESAYEGWDGVSSSVSYTLADNVEGLYLGGENAIDGTGNDLDNEIYGNDYANTLSGLGGADYIVGGYGNDRLIGGADDDLLAGEDGAADVAVYAGLQSSFSLATVDGTVTITDNVPTVDGDEGTDSLYGIEIVEFQGGIQAGISSPIILDLNGNGVTLVDNKQTKVGFDWDGNGAKNQTGWIGKDDGFLFIDRDGNGTVTNAGELSFTSDKDGAKSDLDGLCAFDSNGDGIFSSADDQFSQFKVWRDKNGNGRVDKKEILSIQKAGVASIDLTGEAVNQSWEWGENITVNTGSFTRTNGTVGSFSDVALSYDTASSQNAVINKAASQLSEAMAGFWDGRGTAAFDKFEALAERGDNFLAVARGGWR